MKSLKTILGITLAVCGLGSAVAVGAANTISNENVEPAQADASGNRYIAGSFNSWNASGLQMTKNSASTAWAVSRTFAVNDEFKVTDGTWDNSWGISNKSSDTSEASNFGGDGNIKCTTAGTYTIIINSSNEILIHSGNLSYQSGKEGWVVALNNSGGSSFTVANSVKMDAGTDGNYAQKTGISMNAGAKFQIAYSDGYGFTSSGWKTGDASAGFTKSGDMFVCTNAGTVDVYGYDDGGYKMSAVFHSTSTVTLDKQGGIGGSSSVSADFGSAMPSITLPTRDGYLFGGYFTETGGSGTKYYNSDGSSAKNWDKTGAQTLYASWTRPSGRYLVGDFGDCSWGIDGAIKMSSSSGEYVGTVDLDFGDTIKCAYYNGSSLSSYFGYSNTINSCGAYFCFTNDGSDNLVCYARGTYIFYFTDSYYDENNHDLKLSIEISGSARTSEQLAAKLMSYGPASMASDGSCGSKFSVCKTMYLDNLNSTEQSTFQGYASSGEAQFKNAYDRYTAWARALGENPWAEGKASNAMVVLRNSSENTGTIIAIIVALVASLSIGGYFFIRRRKEAE